MKRIISFIIIILTVGIGLVFALLNSESVSFNYYLEQINIPLSLLLVIALAIGVVIGWIANMGIVIRLKRENAKIRKEAKLSEKELGNLRSLPLKDQH